MKMHQSSLLATVLAGALVALTTSLSAAETKPDRPAGGPRAGQRGEQVKERLAKISAELQLTDEQKTKAAAVLKEEAETLRGLRDATPEERREKMQAARKSFDAKMKDILTADQYAKWEKTREQRGRGGPAGPNKERPKKN